MIIQANVEIKEDTASRSIDLERFTIVLVVNFIAKIEKYRIQNLLLILRKTIVKFLDINI